MNPCLDMHCHCIIKDWNYLCYYNGSHAKILYNAHFILRTAAAHTKHSLWILFSTYFAVSTVHLHYRQWNTSCRCFTAYHLLILYTLYTYTAAMLVRIIYHTVVSACSWRSVKLCKASWENFYYGANYLLNSFSSCISSKLVLQCYNLLYLSCCIYLALHLHLIFPPCLLCPSCYASNVKLFDASFLLLWCYTWF